MPCGIFILNGGLMNDFTFYSPTEFVFGRGITDSVGEKLSQKGYKRVLLVYGKGSVVRSGTLDRVKNLLQHLILNLVIYRE